MHSHIGEIAAFGTAICWTVTSIAFESAGKKVGSFPLNLIRLVMAIFFVSIFTVFSRGMFFPIDASINNWIWLSLSGIIGFVIGDLLLFESLVRNGSRITMLIMASVPPITGILSFLFLNEVMSLHQITGMLITLFGINLVILKKSKSGNQLSLSHPLKDLLFAFGGAIGQSSGLILSKIGMGEYNPIAATQIRIIAAVIGFIIVFTIKRQWPLVIKALKNRPAMTSTAIGSFFGPSIGVSLSLISIKYTNPGIASTIMSLTPILVIPFAYFYQKETMSLREIFGAFVAVSGVAYIFMT
ncbi:MAG: DMT family transporter [Clostridiales bacterium]|nr:DMT family transporter [Clostridiales bacterium]